MAQLATCKGRSSVPSSSPVVRCLAALAVLTCTSAADAQTWAGNLQRPSLRDIATVDQTGEANWLWGQEDVAGNGLNQFTSAEQAIDARSVYIRDAGGRLWWRLYFSSTVEPSANVTAYLFIDTDLDPQSGIGANAEALDPALTTDPSLGGYDFVLAVRGDGTEPRLWSANGTTNTFTEITLAANQADAEAGVWLDPLRIGTDQRGYVQVSLANELIGITNECQANFYVRTTNQTQALGAGDLDVGQAVACIPADANGNRVPDVVEPAVECVSDAECPNGGICWNGRCWLAPVCNDNADCPAGYTCLDGACIVTAGTNCSVDTDCNTGLCSNGRCVVCNADSDCNTGQVCAPDGRCVDESTAGPGMGGAGGGTGNPSNVAGTGAIVLGEGERIQGGSCACRISAPASRGLQLASLGLLGILLLGRRRRSLRTQQRRDLLAREQTR